MCAHTPSHVYFFCTYTVSKYDLLLAGAECLKEKDGAGDARSDRWVQELDTWGSVLSSSRQDRILYGGWLIRGPKVGRFQKISVSRLSLFCRVWSRVSGNVIGRENLSEGCLTGGVD